MGSAHERIFLDNAGTALWENEMAVAVDDVITLSASAYPSLVHFQKA